MSSGPESSSSTDMSLYSSTDMSSGPASSSSTDISPRPGFIFDVFLSFGRDDDTRKNFTDPLYTALVEAGIHIFRDNSEIQRGEDISSRLIEAIRRSRICLVIFSKGYAFSRWCLDELAEILDCKHATFDQIVIPIFYDIDPSDVSKQSGPFAEAFERHEECFREEIEKVKRWRAAVLEAGNLAGWSLTGAGIRYESKLIPKIVQSVINELRNRLKFAKYPVGIEPRVTNVINLLSIGSNDVRTVGIHGMAGTGKTNIAKAVFNQLCLEFEGSCFLLNVREMSKKPRGLMKLQKQLLSDIGMSYVQKIHDVDFGFWLIKARLWYKRVLIVIDDADHLEQLHALMGDGSWLGLGSRIIITTRNQRLLTEFQVNEELKVSLFNQTESLELFSWHAFRDTRPAEDFLELATSVVPFCQGVPLALEVLGSFLFKRRERAWERIVDKIKNFPSNGLLEEILGNGLLDEILGNEIPGKPGVNNVINLPSIGSNDVLNKLETTEWTSIFTTEWTLLITSLLLEGISAIFDQLGYALLGMVMAFIALFLSTIDIVHMARKERNTLDVESSVTAHVTPAGKPFGTVVEYFGLVGAVWQCLYSTMQYAYARQNKDNPIKMCLLPFLFAVCVVIAKLTSHP